MTLNFTSIWTYFPSITTGTLTSVRNSGNVVYNISNLCLSPDGVHEGQTSNGVYIRRQTSFLIGVDEVATVPKVSDYITWDNHKWVVQKITNPMLNSPYMLSTDSLELQLELASTIMITLPVNSIDPFTSPVVTPGVAYSGVRAAIQQVGNEVVVFNNKQGIRNHYDIYTLLEIDLPLGTLIKDQDNVVYIVRGSQAKSRIDELFVYNCYINP